MSLFALNTYFSQIDFMIIKLLVGMVVQWFATYRYLRNKEHEPTKFAQYFRQSDEIPTVELFTGDDAATETIHTSAKGFPGSIRKKKPW